MIRAATREPDFSQLEKVLRKEKPSRTVLFEFIIGEEKKKILIGQEYDTSSPLKKIITNARAFDSAGYDFTPILIPGLEFPRKEDHHEGVQTKSLNAGGMISSWEELEQYHWPDLKNCSFSYIKEGANYLHPKAKWIAYSHDGILENAIGIIGYENLCYLIYDDYPLVETIFNEIGKRIHDYFLACLEYDDVGAIICNDDWGFNTQTLIAPEDLRKLVFPWYKKIVEAAHQKNKYAILHSCGYYQDIITDIIENMKFDGRHSYEDSIVPVEQAYQDLHKKIAVLGGIDLNFLMRSTSEEVYLRAKDLVIASKKWGGYALGTGNSVPDFIPNENFLALLKAAFVDFD